MSCVSKLYTSVINSRLTQWAEDNDVLSEAQAGFRKDYSTVDHIFALHAMVSKHLKKNKKLYVAFVDFRKAFDTVKRNVLWNVLLQLGIGGNMFNTLRAMYSSVLSCVRCNPRNADYFNCMQGLKTGLFGKPRPVLLSDKRTGLRDSIKRKNMEFNYYQEKLSCFYLCLLMILLCFHPHQSDYRTS